ncbi:MAG TPA: dockerin type I domain-containing protein [Longimicrobium sp.]|nr:dockerin type I domain-containing protein [Longimicrobium sp.]
MNHFHPFPRPGGAARLGLALACLAAAPAHGQLALGDSVRGAISAAAEVDTVRLAVTAGDSVDIGAFSRTRGWYALSVTIRNDLGEVVGTSPRVTRPNYRVDGSAEIAPRIPVPRTGTWTVLVADGPQSNFNFCPCTYALHTRRAGPVLVSSGPDLYVNAVAGSAPVPVGDFEVRNMGVSSGSFAVNLDSAGPWLSPSRPGGTVHGPNGAPVAVRMTASPGALPPGGYDGTFSLDFPGDVWNGSQWYRALLRLSDPRGVVLDTIVYTQMSSVAIAPDGMLVVVGDRSLVRMDPATGATTPWVTGLEMYLGGIAFGADSVLYVADRTVPRILRVTPQGQVSTLFTLPAAPLDIEVLPDGTMFVSGGGSIVRRAPDGTVSTLLSGIGDETALAYREGWIYYARRNRLHRVNAETGQDEQRGVLPSAYLTLWEMEFGESGRLYAPGFYGQVNVMDDNANLLDQLWPPGGAGSFALGDSVLYGTGGAFMTWKMPLADTRARHDALVGDPSRDGQITSADALGVLSYVVGRPLPQGWVMTVRGDANCDGEITAIDALIILSKVVEKDVSAFCVGGRR